VRVLHPIQNYVQSQGGRSLVQCCVAFGYSESHHSLMMRRPSGRAVQLLLRLEAHGDAASAAQLHQFLNARTRRILRNKNAFQGPARPERLPDRMDSCEDGH